MSPFAPKGDRSLRVIVTELAAGVDRGETLTFEELAKVLNIDLAKDGARTQIRAAVTAARKTLLQEHSRALVPVRGVGYRVAMPGEHAGIARQHQDRSQRQVQQAIAVIDNADESAMTEAELQRHRATQVVIHNLSRRMTSAEERLATLEEIVDNVLVPKPPVIQGAVESS